VIQGSQCGAINPRQPDSDRAGQCVVEYRGDENAGDDGPGLAQAGGEDEGQQLSLVADLGDGDQVVEVRKASKEREECET
jgi:hypothetical protein